MRLVLSKDRVSHGYIAKVVIMDQNEDKDDFLTAIESVEKKNKPKSKQTKEKKEKLISVKTIGEYKNNEIAVNVNKFLSTNIDPDAGSVLFGENLARAGEYYGLKSTPIPMKLVKMFFSVLFGV